MIRTLDQAELGKSNNKEYSIGVLYFLEIFTFRLTKSELQSSNVPTCKWTDMDQTSSPDGESGRLEGKG